MERERLKGKEGEDFKSRTRKEREQEIDRDMQRLRGRNWNVQPAHASRPGGAVK